MSTGAQREHRVEIHELTAREYWSPHDAARVLGRGPDFWRIAYDNADVEGYDEYVGGKRRRYLMAASARAYLQERCRRSVPRAPHPENAEERETVATFFASQGAPV
jgi:hypothetical protein